MIAINRNSDLKQQANDAVKIKIVGIGGAGSNALDRIALDGLENIMLVSLNTDVQSLDSSVAGKKIQLGRSTTRGLGCGGDPELGYTACKEAEAEIRKAFEDTGMVFLCVGLGGGTGSGSAPLVASLAKEQGALVIALATMPFNFEGKRRSQQALEALALLQEEADVVICFDNDKMGDSVPPKAGIHQAFASADQFISQSVKTISNLFTRPGLIRIGFDDLAMALRNNNARCLFGYGESDGDNRVHDALTRALKNPLMDRGRMLADAQNVLVNIAGGPAMTLNEVQILMDELGKHINDCAQILFGTAVDARMGNKVSVAIITSIGDGQTAQVRQATPRQRHTPTPAPAPEPVQTPVPEPVEEPAMEAIQQESEPLQEVEPVAVPIDEPAAQSESEPVYAQEPETFSDETLEPESDPAGRDESTEYEAEPVSAATGESQQEALLDLAAEKPAEDVAPTPVTVTRSRKFAFPVPAKPVLQSPPVLTRKAAPEPRQETLQFEPVTRGRFEKSEPTIIDGQDLDVPTFLRRNVRVK